MATETVIIKGDDITIDLLLWRRYKRRTPGLVEQALALNPGLAALGPTIPVGTEVVLPVDAPSSTPVRRGAVRLWN